MNETRTLAQFIVDLSYESLPARVAEVAKLCILDTIGVGLFGSRMPWADMVAGLAMRARHEGDSVVWGRTVKTLPEYAALVNGTAAHGIEMDDRKPSYSVHTGAAVIPTALAVGEAASIDGKKFIAAVVVGYEVAYRVGKAVPGQLERGIHPAGHKAIWGAVAAASKALDLSLEESLNAFGIAGSMASGVWEFSRDPQGAMVKRLHMGWPAHSGVIASLLAKSGFSGPSSILEGQYGYCRVFAGEHPLQIAELTRDLGCSFMILEREVKPYAAWGSSHPCIEAVTTLRAKHGITPDIVDKVTITGSRSLFLGHETSQPKSIMAAQYSLPFIAAVSFFRDLRDPSIWTEELVNDRNVLGLADKVTCRLDDEMDKMSRESRAYGGVRLTVKLQDGRELSESVYHSKGTVASPMTSEEIAAKFNMLAEYVLPKRQVTAVAEVIQSMDSVKDVRELGRLLLLA